MRVKTTALVAGVFAAAFALPAAAEGMCGGYSHVTADKKKMTPVTVAEAPKPATIVVAE